MPARVTITSFALLLVVLLAWLRDPPWICAVTSGLGPVVADVDGRPVRWTRGHAVFYIPSSAATLAIPLRARRPRRGHDGQRRDGRNSECLTHAFASP